MMLRMTMVTLQMAPLPSYRTLTLVERAINDETLDRLWPVEGSMPVAWW
jgi:hypothetical protein